MIALSGGELADVYSDYASIAHVSLRAMEFLEACKRPSKAIVETARVGGGEE
jgi:hypothetical protein